MLKSINILKLVRSFLLTIILCIIYFFTKNGKVIMIPFIFCSVALLLKDLFIVINKVKYIKIFDNIYIISFLVFWFGFLLYFDYLCIKDKNYQLLLFSLIFWLIGISIVKKGKK